MIRTIEGPADWVWSISVSRDGGLIASASGDNTVRVWRTADATPLLTLQRGIQGIRAVALSPDGKLIAAALEDKTIRVWRVTDGALVYTLTGHTDWVRCVTFSPDGGLLASGAFDDTVRIWDMSAGKLLRTLTGHTSSVLSVAFSPDGQTLASGSEEDVRLWQVRDGSAMQILRGHTSFVYAVAFSPDGKTLASGGADNTVRLWDLEKVREDPSTAAPTPQTAEAGGTAQAAPLDCRQCHHPRGQALPPRVTILPCEGCHANGANLEWCPSLPRDIDALTRPIQYTAYSEHAAVPIGGDGIAVLIASPSNGETLYAKNGIRAPAFVTGQVFSGAYPSNKIQVVLQVWSGSQMTTTLVKSPSSTGEFKFNLGINLQGSLPYGTKPNGADCVSCHEDYRPEGEMPSGAVRIVVIATDSEGHRASDERRVSVDSSGTASLPVQVIDSVTGQPLDGISVTAGTILYEWRGRFGSAVTATDGKATLGLEAPSQAAATYDVSIPPQIVNGVLFSSGSTPVKLEPGANSHPGIVLRASAQRGQIAGTLDGGNPGSSLGGMKVWAVQLPAGPAYQSLLTAQNMFSFAPLPVSQYQLGLDVSELAARGLSAESQTIDLTASPTTTTAIGIAQGRTLSGKLLDGDGNALPFAWIRINGEGPAQAADPTSGKYLITSMPDDGSFVTVSAPGYYSQSRHVPADQKSLDLVLVPQPETQATSWGKGQIVIPSSTNVTAKGTSLDLSSGWLWGKGAASQPANIQVSGIEVRISDGQFALEDAPGRLGWLYLYQGTAQIRFPGRPPIDVKGGEMLALQASASPFPMNETAALALHPALAEAPVPEVVQPSFAARLENWLEKAGIGAAQTITFITYILSLVALFTIPMIGLFWILRRRKESKMQEKRSHGASQSG